MLNRMLPTPDDIYARLGMTLVPLAVVSSLTDLVIRAAQTYTRGNGFAGDKAHPELVALVIAVVHRVIVMGEDQGHAVFQGFTLAEQSVLNRHRKVVA